MPCWEAWTIWKDLVTWKVKQYPYAMIFLIHNAEIENLLALNFKPVCPFPWE